MDATYYAEAANNGIHDVALEDICISALVKVDSGAGATLQVVTKSNVAPRWQLYLDSGVVFLYLQDSDPDTYYLGGDTDIRDNKWHHIAAVLDRDNAANCKIFLDGKENNTFKSGTLADLGTLTNTHTFNIGARNNGDFILDSQIADVKLYYATGAIWSDAEVLYQFNNPFDYGAGAGTLTDYWTCNDNAADAVVTGAVNNLTASANTEDFATYNWKRYDMTFQADQAAIVPRIRITGAGAGANSATIYLDKMVVKENLVVNGAMEGGADPPASWIATSLSTVTSNTDSHSGTNAAKVVTSATQRGVNTGAAITLVVGEYYTASLWAKISTGTAPLTFYNNNTAFSQIFTLTTSYQLLQVTFKATGANGKIHFQLDSSTGTFYVDDVVLERKDTAPASTADRNRSFAAGAIGAVGVWDMPMGFEEVQQRKDEI